MSTRASIYRVFRRPLGVVAVSALAASALVACGASGSNGSTSKGAGSASKTLVVGISGDPATLDPGQGQDVTSNELIKNTYLQWTKYATGPVTGDYAVSDVSKLLGEAASYTFSSDNKVATFTIPSGEKFANGDPITSDDFIYTVKRALVTKLAPLFDFNLLGITSVSQVKKINAQSFTITLPQPTALFGQMLRDQDASVLDAKVVESHATAKDPWALNWMASNSIGGGAYTVATDDPGNQIILTKNPNYPGAKDVYFTKVILRIIPSATERQQLLANGTLDIAEDISLSALNDLKTNKSVKVLSIPSRAQDMFVLNQTQKPFSDPRVREAMAKAMDYTTLAKNVQQGYALTPKGVWPQESASFDSSATNNPFTTNVADAKKLLGEAGYSGGLSISTEVSTADSTGQALAIAVQSELKQVGVNMTIKQFAPATFSEHLAKKSEQSAINTDLSNYVDDPYYALYLFYNQGANLNWFGLNDSKINSITSELSTTINPKNRQELANAAQVELNAQIPTVILDEPNFTLAMRSNIKGFVLEPDGLIRFGALSRGE